MNKSDPNYPSRYLGDGVYASYDGYQIWLKTEREENGTNSIALDSYTFNALLEYKQDIQHRRQRKDDHHH